MLARPKPHAVLQLAVIFLGLVVGVGAAGHFYYESQKEMITRNRYAELFSIAELKVNQISLWRKGRMGEASIIGNNPLLAHGVQQWLKNPEDLYPSK